MRKVLYPVLVTLLLTALSACQGFLEDYEYKPLGGTGVSSTQ